MKYPTVYRTIQIDALSIFYREAGPKDAPTLLLLHGLPSSSRMFEPLFARSANSCPARFVFLRSAAAKERLRPALAAGNVEKTMAAPVTVIIAYDLRFYDKLPKLFPHNPGMRDIFANNPQLIRAAPTQVNS
jgi:nitroreductase